MHGDAVHRNFRTRRTINTGNINYSSGLIMNNYRKFDCNCRWSFINPLINFHNDIISLGPSLCIVETRRREYVSISIDLTFVRNGIDKHREEKIKKNNSNN